MKKYITPQVEIELFEAQDVMASSVEPTQPTTQDSTDPYVNDPF